MTIETAFVAFGPGKRKVRPSNWIYRLMGIVDVHRQGEKAAQQPCGTCAACPDTTCFVFPASLQDTHPALVRDLKFCLRMLEIPEVSAECPRNADHSCVAQRSAA
ncbi:MAG: hypothetical protein ACYDDO_14875 [Acidiferrobacterales bacterium]